jgi:hypothetical protein
MAMTFRVELVWQGDLGQGTQPCSIYLTKDGRIVLQGKPVSAEDRVALDLPADATLVSIDRALITAIKEML